MARDISEFPREALALPEANPAELAGGASDENVEATWSEEVERPIRELHSGT